MRKLRIKSQLSSIAIFLLAYFLLLVNSWPQETEGAKPEVKSEIKNDAATNDNQNQKPPAPDGNFISNLISSHLTDNALLSKSIANLDSLNDSSANSQAGATTKVINKTSSAIIDTINSKKSVSLMYDADELSGIENAIDSLKNDRVYVPAGQEDGKKLISNDKGNARSYIYLGSILYFGPKNWAVWIDGKKVTYNDNKDSKELYLASVTNSDVSVLWTMSISKWKILSGKKNDDLAPKVNGNNQIEIKFTLKSNQTYSLRSGNVTEGFQVPTPAPATKDDITNSQAPANPSPSN